MPAPGVAASLPPAGGGISSSNQQGALQGPGSVSGFGGTGPEPEPGLNPPASATILAAEPQPQPQGVAGAAEGGAGAAGPSGQQQQLQGADSHERGSLDLDPDLGPGGPAGKAGSKAGGKAAGQRGKAKSGKGRVAGAGNAEGAPKARKNSGGLPPGPLGGQWLHSEPATLKQGMLEVVNGLEEWDKGDHDDKDDKPGDHAFLQPAVEYRQGNKAKNDSEYKGFIKRPMDLGTLRANVLGERLYPLTWEGWSAFVGDCCLIGENCFKWAVKKKYGESWVELGEKMKAKAKELTDAKKEEMVQQLALQQQQK